jgi:two-component system cell cycle sensor histidine kinase/response regulator CckA
VLLVLLAAAASAGLLLWAIPDPVFAAAFFAGLIGLGAVLLLRGRAGSDAAIEAPLRTDISLLRAAVDSSAAAVAVTDAHGAMICANAGFADWFGGTAGPMELENGGGGGSPLGGGGGEARRAATRSPAFGSMAST